MEFVFNVLQLWLAALHAQIKTHAPNVQQDLLEQHALLVLLDTLELIVQVALQDTIQILEHAGHAQ